MIATLEKFQIKFTLKCHITYSREDIEFVDNIVKPILVDNGVIITGEIEKEKFGDIISDQIIRSIRDCNLIIIVLNNNIPSIAFEAGLGIGQNKAIIAIEKDDENTFREFPWVHYVNYNENGGLDFRGKLINSVDSLTHNIIQKPIYGYARTNQILGIKISYEKDDYLKALEFSVEFFRLVKAITKVEKIDLVDTGKGSLDQFISLSAEGIVKLLESIIYFPLNWKAKKLENEYKQEETKHKIEETELLKEKRAKIKAEREALEGDTQIRLQKDSLELAERALEIFERYNTLNITFQIDNQIICHKSIEGKYFFEHIDSEDLEE
ncbi:MAG: hypothetical protein ABUK01_11115 [Leptospirales bacterium]